MEKEDDKLLRIPTTSPGPLFSFQLFFLFGCRGNEILARVVVEHLSEREAVRSWGSNLFLQHCSGLFLHADCIGLKNIKRERENRENKIK